MLSSGPIPKEAREFLVNGWRWHTASVLRDLGRFERILAAEERALLKSSHPITTTSASRLVQCHEFVCKFNWDCLTKVETEMFFPFLRDKLPSEIYSFMSDFFDTHRKIKHLSSRLGKEVNNVQKQSLAMAELERTTDFTFDGSSGSPNSAMHFDAVRCIYHKQKISFERAFVTIAELEACAVRMQRIQNCVFVPCVAAYVDKKEQYQFNNQVIANLGLINSQIHLVSMKDAVTGFPVEENMFREQIPRLVQRLIPVWRRTLYSRKAGCLDI